MKPVIDDYHSPMDAENYLALRLEPIMRFYQKRIIPYNRSKTFCAILLMIGTAGSAILASLGKKNHRQGAPATERLYLLS